MSLQERTEAAPEISEPVFTLKDLVRLAETCNDLEELNDRLREVLPRE